MAGLRRKRPLGVEKLEDRQLMAGIVNILISATEIRFVGDAANNGISVTFQGNWAQIRCCAYLP